jgi:hypothetical protein
MKLIRRLFFLTLFLIIVGVAWCWWNWPRRVDMAQYAPADSLVYLECDNLPAVARSITTTEIWREIGATLGLKTWSSTDRWISLVASLGIGPVESVIFSRAQVAIVMLNLDAAEENTTLKIRPEGAIIIETHTSEWRIRPAVENGLMRFARTMYGETTPKRYREDVDYLEWTSPVSDRRIVAAIDQSLVVVGNSKRAVRGCLDTRRRQRSALRSDPALQAMRTRVGAAQALTFGYISAANAARLFSWSAPVLFGRGPGDSTLEQILSNRAAKVLGSIGWSSHPSTGGIEDRFFFALEPPIVSRLQPVFKVGPSSGSLWQVLPGQIDSVTIYKSETPAQAWEALRAVTSQLDALSAVVFGSLLKASLLPYGIENPERFLNAVGPEVATSKLRKGTGGTVLFARIRDRQTLEQMFKGQAAPASGLDNPFNLRHLEVSERKFAAAFVDEYFVIGPPDDVSICLQALNNGQTLAAEGRSDTLTTFVPDSTSAVVTYSSDYDRVRNFFGAILAFQGRSMSPTSLAGSETKIPYTTTETNLVDQGIERRTRSGFGQFSTLVALLRHD